MRQVTPALDPAPSRWAYRYQRLMLTPFFKVCLRVFLPFLVALGLAGIWLSDQTRRDTIAMGLHSMWDGVVSRPEFMVNVMAIDGASTGIAEDIREVVSIDFPISYFDLDPDQIREQIAELPAVARSTVRIRPGGILQVDIAERDPVILWRSREGLDLVDREGFVVAEVNSRSARSDLPLMAGAGAEEKVDEALALVAAAGPLRSRLVGLVRMGERRWDVVLDRDQRILLPETGSVQAFERVIALSQAQEMLARDLVIVDMRLSKRPTIRIAQRAVKEWWRLRQISVGKSEND